MQRFGGICGQQTNTFCNSLYWVVEIVSTILSHIMNADLEEHCHIKSAKQ